ncbi:archease [Tritrichomonas foetus]|uniref:Protein archease-like n=1 Tax=Tritrichomonas foetus TaxID=1144522 RepID=A0A1J4K807_9EUKA|nr:archease [Tritrichomonas foetus]|eukprot:OHT05565.1 archease [Tritrichomonas foetus]
MQNSGFEYIDHPADIQIHSWGPTIEKSLEPLAVGLFGVMFDPAGFSDALEKRISVKANDLLSLVYQFLDEWLFHFDAHDFVLKKIAVTKCDLENFEIEATGFGEEFDMEKHSDFRRTEVKAITYASMKVEQKADKAEIYVIVDL